VDDLHGEDGGHGDVVDDGIGNGDLEIFGA
jgi:hypothetical protein